MGVREAAKLLREGEIVAVPAETVYGLAADATSSEAVKRIFEAKGRPTNNPLIVHVSCGLLGLPTPPATDGLTAGRCDGHAVMAALDRIGITATSSCATDFCDYAARLISAFWPGPLTLVLPAGTAIVGAVRADGPTVAVRMPSQPLFAAVIDAAGCPVAAPSANPSGRISPTRADDVLRDFAASPEGLRPAAVLDGGETTHGVESTVVRLVQHGLEVLRPGAVTANELRSVVPVVGQLSGAGVRVRDATNPGHAPIASPGMLSSHYAPGKPLYLLPEPVESLSPTVWHQVARVLDGRARIGVLSFSASPAATHAQVALHLGLEPHVVMLTPTGDWAQAARRFFAALHELDEGPAPVLIAEPIPLGPAGAPNAVGTLADALADRLARASRPLPELEDW
jgi:L-threonylcarbamoyladenylate synthase